MRAAVLKVRVRGIIDGNAPAFNSLAQRDFAERLLSNAVALIALLVLDAVLALVVWRVGRWTSTLAAINVASNAAAATLLIWLLSRGELLTDLPSVLGERFGWSTDWSVPTALVAAGIVIVTLWDGLESVVKARRTMRGQLVT